MKQRSFVSRMLVLALPIAFQNLLTSCAHLVDTAMVVVLGNAATAAVGVAGRWSFFINIVIFGMCSGASSFISQFWGARDSKNIRKTVNLATVICVLLAVVYCVIAITLTEPLLRFFTNDPEVIGLAAQYMRIACFTTIFLAVSSIRMHALRATEDVNLPLICSFISVVVNTFLNYCLIGGNLGFPALGLRGAALATVIASAVQTVLIEVLARRKKGPTVGPLGEYIHLDRELAPRFFRIAMPVLMNELIWVLGTNGYDMVLARRGTENYAGYTISNSVQQLCFVFFIGICHACAIMVGKTIGEGDLDGAYKLARKFMFITFGTGIVLGCAIILLRHPILSLLAIETETARKVAADMLVVYGLWLPMRNIPYTGVVGTFRAGGDTKIGLYYDMITLYGIALPLVAILGFFTDVPFVALIAVMYVGEDLVKVILTIKRFRSRKWINRLTVTDASDKI